MGLTKARKAKKLLNKYAPKGEKLAYINDKEAKLLKSMGGAGIDINGTGIKSYIDFGYGPGSVSESLGGGSSSSSSSSSSSDSGGEGVYDPPAQSYTPAPAPSSDDGFDTGEEFGRATYADQYATSYSEPDTTGEDQEEDVARMMIDMGIIPDNAPIGFTPTTGEDGLGEGDYDDGESLYVQTTGEDQEEDVARMEVAMNINQPPGILSDEDAKALSYVNFGQPIRAPEPKGIFQTIGSGLKTAAKIALPFVASGFLPPTAAKVYTGYNQAKTVANLANKVGLTDKTLPTLTEFAKNIPRGTTINRPPTGYEGDGDNRPIPKDVVTASVQKYSPAQINNLQSNISLLESVLDSGQYRGTKLNSLQLSQVSNQRNSLLEQYNMIQEYLV